MTDQSLPAGRFAERDFSAGHAFNRAFQLFSRNLLPFSLITLFASLPNLLILWPQSAPVDSAATGGRVVLGVLLMSFLNTLAQAIVLYAAFDDMRGRPVNMAESLRVGLRRFFPALGVAICTMILTWLAAIGLIFPAFIVVTMLFVAIPACVVEKLGPIKSLGRSARLTKGHRWQIFGLWIATIVCGAIAGGMLSTTSKAIGGLGVSIAVQVGWGAVFGAFNAILAVVVYHDLRVAKEGVDTDQIAAVFD